MKKNEDNKKLDMMLENIYNSDSPCIFNFCCDNSDVRAEVIRVKKSKKIVAWLVATAVGVGRMTILTIAICWLFLSYIFSIFN